jgi:hypothetical protein
MSYLPGRSAVVMHGGWGAPDWNPRDRVWRFAAGAAPTPVQGLRIGRDAADVVLTWSPMPGSAGYEVLSAPAPEGPYAPDTGGAFSGERWQKNVTAIATEFYSVSAIE